MAAGLQDGVTVVGRDVLRGLGARIVVHGPEVESTGTIGQMISRKMRLAKPPSFVGGPWISRWARAAPARDFAH